MIEHLRTLPPGLPETINLMGNHEDMLLAALDGNRSDAELWMGNGGVAALDSWNVPPRTNPRNWPKLLPTVHQTFIRNLAISHAAGSYLFVHAGIRPGIAFAHQTRQDLLWIRDTFLTSTATHQAIVVHGHTPEHHTPTIRNNRINLDTGAVLGGPLTCAILQTDCLRFLTA